MKTAIYRDNKMLNSFWMGFIIGGIVCVAIFELIQFIVLSAIGVKSLEKQMKRKNDIQELKMNRLRKDTQERSERKEPTL